MDRFNNINNNNESNSLERIKELDKMNKYGNVNDYSVFGDNEQIKMFMDSSNNNEENAINKEELEQNNAEEVNNDEKKLDNNSNDSKNNISDNDKNEINKDNISEKSEEKKYENKADELLDKVKGIKIADIWSKFVGSKSDEEDSEEPRELERLGMSVAKVMTVYLTLFILLIGYISYFQIFKAPSIEDKESNPRVLAKRNETLRGPIYDRNNKIIAESEKKGKLSQVRKYPYEELYAHPIGYSDDRYSRTGLEKDYDKYLRDDTVPFSFDGIISKLKSIGKSVDGIKTGNTIVTTLDTKVQQSAWNVLGDKKGAIVVLNPKTGEVLASVSKPSYNPNDLEKVMTDINSGKIKSEDSPVINRVTDGKYPPGSTFKVITLASAYENIEGIESKTFNDTGTLKIGDSTLSNQNKTAYGNLDVKKGLAVSSNVVYGTLAGDLGNDKLKSTAENFGFNNSIPSDGMLIAKSSFPSLGSSEVGNIAQSGIGQGEVLATPMQMALVACGIANNGIIMEPKLVNEIRNQKGDIVETIEPKEYKTAVKGSIASKVKNDMVGVINYNPNRASFSDLRAIKAAGKTGTADYKLANGTDGVPHAWFIGFAPADNPQVAISVIVEGGGNGGDVAAPIAGKVMRTALGK